MKGDDNPVENISWFDAVIFCNKLSVLQGLEPCYLIGTETNLEKIDFSNPVWNRVLCNFNARGYRLPTEAEAGSMTASSVRFYIEAEVLQ